MFTLDRREGLIQAMLDRVTATFELEPPDAPRWRAQLHSLLRRLHQALLAHPGTAAVTLADPPTTETVLLLAENLLGILLAGGLDPQDAAWACDISMAWSSEPPAGNPPHSRFFGAGTGVGARPGRYRREKMAVAPDGRHVIESISRRDAVVPGGCGESKRRRAIVPTSAHELPFVSRDSDG
jgi:hypothetical protein